jgi:hypothetical protein
MRFDFKTLDAKLQGAILAAVMLLAVWSVGRSGYLVFLVPAAIGALVAGVWISRHGR